MAIKIIPSPKDVYVTYGELMAYTEDYEIDKKKYKTTPPSLEEYIRIR